MTKKYLMAGILSLSLMILLAIPLLVGAQEVVDWDYVNIGLSKKDLIDVVNAIITIALGLLGIIAVVIILIGGFEWMTAGGSSDKVASAQKRIGAGIVGLVVIFIAYGLAYFVISRLVNVTTE